MQLQQLSTNGLIAAGAAYMLQHSVQTRMLRIVQV